MRTGRGAHELVNQGLTVVRGDSTIVRMPVPKIAWRSIPPDRHRTAPPTVQPGPPVLTVSMSARGDHRVARGYLSQRAVEHFAGHGLPYVLLETGEDDAGNAFLRLRGLPDKSNPLAVKIVRNSTASGALVSTQFRRLVVDGAKLRVELEADGDALVGPLPKPVRDAMRASQL
jgi:hypothetical protein